MNVISGILMGIIILIVDDQTRGKRKREYLESIRETQRRSQETCERIRKEYEKYL